jgi:transposase
VLEVLRELLSEGRAEAIVELVQKLLSRNTELEKRLADLLARRHKNEGVSTAQLLLFLDALAAPTAEPTAGADGAVAPGLNDANQKLREAAGIDDKKLEQATTRPPRKQPPLRRSIPAHLPRTRNEIKVPAAERACPRCGRERECIGHDVTEVIDLIPAQVIVRQDAREKLACGSCEGEVVRAPLGDKVIEGGRLGSSLVAELLVDKYRDGLPLNRQMQRFARLGLPVSVSTLADQVKWATELLAPLHRCALAEILKANVLHVDGTGLPVLDRQAAGGVRLGTLWGYVGDDTTALYLYASTGKKDGQLPGELGPQDVLKLRTGYVVADASSVFDASFKREQLVECGCNMHGRRYFAKALDRGDKRAALPLAAYKKLYDVEEKCARLDAEARRSVRQAESKPVFDELASWCQIYQPHEQPGSPLGAAIRYFLNNRVALARFLEDGAVPIDNGIVERLHVRAALTRKNFLFAGSDAGGERAAIAYTILSCCTLAKVNPVEYLRDVLPRLTRRVRIVDVPGLMPAAWKAARETGTAAAPAAAAPS